MARRTIGSRRVGTDRPTPTITAAEVQEFRDAGRKVVERPGGIVLLDGFRKFEIVGEAKDVERRKPKDEEIEGLSGGNELTGFDFNARSRGVNELTDFDPGDMGMRKGSNNLIDFE